MIDEFLIKIELPEKTLTKLQILINNANFHKVDISNRSTKGKYSEQFNLDKNHYNDLNELYKEILIEDILPDYLKEKYFSVISSWIINGNNGSYHKIHRHTPVEKVLIKPDMTTIATVMYLQVPDVDSGDFYFLLRKKDDVLLRTLTPKRGDFYIMPCTVYHGVYPQGPGLRQVFNADLQFKNYAK